MADRNHAPEHSGQSRRTWLQTLEICGLCVLYVTAFWGQAAQLLPAPLDQWHSLLYRASGRWWHEHVATALSHREQVALYQLVEALFVGMLVPVWILRRKGRTMRDAGLRVPGRSAVGPTIVGIVLSLPVGLYLNRTVAGSWGTPLQEGLGLLSVIPEHFLIFGVVGALLLPRGRLTVSVRELHTTCEAVFALAVTASIFGLVHVGVEHPSVLIASLPVGVVYAYLTLCTGSIWPAVIGHSIMNVVPMAWDVLST